MREFAWTVHGALATIGVRMKVRGFLVAQFLLVTAAAWSQTGKPVSEYAGIRDQLKSGNLSVDFKQLRISHVGSAEYAKAKDTSKQSAEMIRAINVKDFKKAIKNAEVVLENDYSDMDAHFAEYIAYRESGDSKQADFHRSVFDGLLKSILSSGDGRSKETAYVVASVHEEYVVLRVLGLQPHNQSLAHDGGHSYDVLEAKDRNSGKSIQLYFNVDIPMSHLMSIFGEKK